MLSNLSSQKAKAGAVDLSDILSDIPLSTEVNVPDLGSFSARKPQTVAADLFAEKSRAGWKQADDAVVARCDFDRKLALTRRSDVTFLSLWKKSVYGRTLEEIKADPNMVGFFADNLASMIRESLGVNLAKGGWAICTTPKRRHLQRNFASLISAEIAARIGIPFYEDVASCHSKHRVNAVFTLNFLPEEQNLIVFDDFVTTGQTLRSMRLLLEPSGKNLVFAAGINNKL